ncbi:MAG: hypothetical protein ACLPP9_07570 [Smithella sp.]
MPSFQWIQHKGKRILYMDIATPSNEELIDITERIKKVIANEPPKSVLCLVNVKGGKFNTEINQTVKEFAKFCDPYVKVSASIGVEGLMKIIHNAIVMFTGNKSLVLKNSREEALDWLVEQ